jgi:hypothetical protein
VSRRSFRVDVAEPRPASAWALVTVASAMLWITQQLAPWVVTVQVAFLLYTLAVRTRPRPWQQNPIALNVGMFFIVAVTIRVALHGGPSTIALAHFAALTQALQLVDARPRRTEFLLVALALFQVVLASNLTDSVFFPPLLVAFVFATVWTLIVHTLRSEALEADERTAVSRALTPGLVKMTLFATGMSVVLALALFVVLPRLRSSVVTGSNFSPVVATAGFSDKVTLGELGRIRQDSTVVMRVETVEGPAPERAQAYWRGLAFDHFDGSSWSITPATRHPVPGSAEGGVTFGQHPDQFNLAQAIVREPVEAGVIFGIGDKRALQGTVRRLQTDVNGGLYAAGQSHERIRYRAGPETATTSCPSSLPRSKSSRTRSRATPRPMPTASAPSSATCSPTDATATRPLPSTHRRQARLSRTSSFATWRPTANTTPRRSSSSRAAYTCRRAS